MIKRNIFAHFVLAFFLTCSLSVAGYADPGKGNQGNKQKHSINKYDKYDKKQNKKYKNKGNKQGDATDILISAGISLLEARLFAESSQAIGYSPLPPGIQKNLLRGKPLPPGIAKKMIPGGMLAKLPNHPGYDWRVAGTDLILVHAATHVIADILRDVFK